MELEYGQWLLEQQLYNIIPTSSGVINLGLGNFLYVGP
jgi:hypothetical protein